MFSSVDPFVRYAAKSTYFIDSRVRARDCHLLYILSGRGNFECEGERSYPLLPGALVYYPPGVAYHISSKDGMLFYTVNFDFTKADAEREGTILAPSAEKSVGAPLLDGGIPDCFKKPIYVGRAESAEPLLKEIYSECARSGAYSADAASCAMKLLLITLYRISQAPTGERTLFSEIKERVRQNPAQNNLELARGLSYHPYYLNEVFKQNEGVSLHKYIMKERLVKARELITASALSFEKIAAECGFSSASHLSRSIKAEYGISPLKMRKL